MNKNRSGLVVFAITLLLLSMPLAGVLGSSAANNAQLRHPSSKLDSSRAIASSPSFLKYSFFPREPRLQDVKPISGFAPIGIASYGPSGTLIRTDGVRGEATINEMSIGFFSAEEVNNSVVTPYFGAFNATLQENAVLWLRSLGAYWTQNVISIEENNPQSYSLQLIDNIWNFTSAVSNMNLQATSGSGSVQCMNLNNRTSCFYFTVDPTVYTVQPPFNVKLSMSLENGSSAAAAVSFQYQITDSGGKNYTGQYDSVKLFPSVSNAEPYFQIGGNSPVSYQLPGGTALTLPSDLELTLGGPGGGSSVFINSIAGSEQLFYLNGTSYVPVPVAYSVGSDTAEQASGVNVTPNLGNSSSPKAMLSSGFDNSELLWPLHLSLVVSGQNNFSNGSLDLRGVALYNGNSSSAAIPAPNLFLRESQGPSSAVTDENGEFEMSFTPNSSGIFDDIISYGGSIALVPTNLTMQIAVSSVSVTSSKGANLLANFNSTQQIIQNQSTILVPVLKGSSISVSFQNVSSPYGSQRELFLGFGNSSNPQSSVLLDGDTSQSVNANFVKQFLVIIQNPYTGQDVLQWYNESSAVHLSAPNTVSSRSGGSMSFENWLINGNPTNSTSSLTVPANGPLVIIAEYSPSSSSTIAIEAGVTIVALIVGLGTGYYIARRRNRMV